MHSQSAQWPGRKKVLHTSRPSGRREQRKAGKEQTRLVQLLVCLTLFLTVFLGKGVFPQGVVQVRQRLQELIVSDTDFRGAFAQLGETLTDCGPVWDELGAFCVEVFGGGQVQMVQPPDLSAQVDQEQEFLNSGLGQAEVAAHYLHLDQVPQEWFSSTHQDPQESQTTIIPEPEAAVPAVGTVVMEADYTGEALPENYTMDQISLGDLETCTPVLGRLTSEYGYRDHPIDGEYKLHTGVDIGGQQGDPICAFADGTVDYIGENSAYGQYLQLDHGNGIKSFYAHCSKLCVSKGQPVAMGEKVAEVGSTGVSTGPHLHLELKWEGLHLNPIYYIDVLER